MGKDEDMGTTTAAGEEQGAALRQLKQSCEALRGVLGDMHAQKAAGSRDQHDRRSPRDADKARAKEQRWRALLLLRGLKAGLRDTFLASDAWKARVQEQKDRVEAHQLKLQNLLYEKDHLAREIRRCRGFRCVSRPSSTRPLHVFDRLTLACRRQHQGDGQDRV
jgi:hypothetical protein